MTVAVNINAIMQLLERKDSTMLCGSGTVNSKSFVGKVLLRIKWKFELTYAL